MILKLIKITVIMKPASRFTYVLCLVYCQLLSDACGLARRTWISCSGLLGAVDFNHQFVTCSFSAHTFHNGTWMQSVSLTGLKTNGS